MNKDRSRRPEQRPQRCSRGCRCRRDHCDHDGDLRRVRGLWLSPGWRRAAPSRHDRQFQEGAPPHARARPAAQAPAAVYGHDHSDHDNPIFPDLARDRVVDGPNQLWVADITYIAIAASFVYLAAILAPGRAEWSDMRSAVR